jgi:hypothetical protein
MADVKLSSTTWLKIAVVAWLAWAAMMVTIIWMAK